MPKLRVDDGERQSVVALGDGSVSVGRDPGNRVVISDALASRKHCTFEASGEKVLFVDLGSSNGSLVNGKRVTKAELKAGDRVAIGDVVIEIVAEDASSRVVDLDATPVPEASGLSPVKDESLVSSQTATGMRVRVLEPVTGDWIPVKGESFKIGRNPENDLVLDDPRVSGEHGAIIQRADGWIVADLGSANGISVGGRKAKKVQAVNELKFEIGESIIELAGFPPSGDSAASPADGFSESDVLRFKKERLEVAPNPQQGLLTGLFVVCLGVILWSGFGFVEDFQRGRTPTLDSDDILGGSGSFEDVDLSLASWKPASGSSVTALTTPISEDAPHGQRVLSFSGNGGDFGVVRIEETSFHEVTSDHGLLLTGKVSNDGFSRVGLGLRWYSRRAGEEILIEEEFTALREQSPGRFSNLSGRFLPPRWGDPAAVRVMVVGLGSGRLRADQVMLKIDDQEGQAPDIATLNTGGNEPLTVHIDPHGVATVTRGGALKIQDFRLALGTARARPWGQMMPSRIETPVVGEDGTIQLNFELEEAGRSCALNAFARSFGTRVQMSWQPRSPEDLLLAARIPAATERLPAKILDGELLVESASSLSSLIVGSGDVVILGSGKDQVVLTLGHKAEISFHADPGDGLGSLLAMKFGSIQQGDAIDCFISEVSDREEARINSELTRIEDLLSKHREGEARRLVEQALIDFSWRPDLITRLEAIRNDIDEMALAFESDLVRAKKDLDTFPGGPVLRYLRENCAQAKVRFAGMKLATVADRIASGLLEEEVKRIEVQESAALSAIIERGEDYFKENRDELARFYFEWVIAKHPDSPKNEPVQQFLRLIEARKQ